MDSPNSKQPFPFPSMEDTSTYFCIARGTKILHSAGVEGLDAFAVLCLQSAPKFHSWYFHTVAGRTLAFLFDDGCTFFAIVASTDGGLAAVRLLQTIRDGFRKNELVPVLQTLVASLKLMSRPAGTGDDSSEMLVSSSMTKALLGRNSSRVTRDRAVESSRDGVMESRKSCEDCRGDRAVKIDIKLESSSSFKSRGQLSGRRLWWRYVKIVAVVDVLLCLVLFGIWMGVCRGFQCVSSS